METFGRPQTANEILQDRAIRHAIYLQRLKSGEANRILALLSRDVYSQLRQVIRDRVMKMERLGTETGPVTTQRLNEIEQSIRQVTEALERGRLALEQGLFALGASEASWQVKAIRSASPVHLDLVTPSPTMLRSIVISRPFQGRLLSSWWSGLDTGIRQGVRTELNVGIALGRTNAQIVRRLLDPGGGQLAISRRNADAIVRTSIAHVSNHARQETYSENDDIVDRWEWVATLSPATCLICAPLDGTTYPVGEHPKAGMPGTVHFRCKCTSTPVLKSWKELGINLKEAPAGTRAALDGAVPESTNYEEWMRSQPAAVQNEEMGPARAQLFRDRRFSLGDFTDDHGRTLTLTELEAIPH